MTKYIPNQSSLKHYAITNIFVSFCILFNFGFIMGIISGLAVQYIIEVNQYKNSKMKFKDYFKKYGIDLIWDCIFAICGIITTQIYMIK